MKSPDLIHVQVKEKFDESYKGQKEFGKTEGANIDYDKREKQLYRLAASRALNDHSID